jgi:hypothetical protein
MANWHLNYGINGKAPGSKKLNTNLVSNADKLQLTMGGGIPEGIVPIEQVFALVEKHLVGLDDLDAEKPENHAKTLRAIAAYSTELADLISQ